MKSEAHTLFPDKKTAPRYLPDFSAKSVMDIDFEQLKRLGAAHVLFDLDLTLRSHNAAEIEAEIITYLVELRDKGVISSLNLATNNIHDVSRFSEPLGARVFQPFRYKGRFAHKPHRVYFDRIVRELNLKPSEIVMIGDKVQFDVAGGNRAGMWTVLVDPLSDDALHDKLLLVRWRHNRLLKAARKLAEATRQNLSRS